jgi:hypothetical protein
MDPDTCGCIGVALLAVSCAVPLWRSWLDFRKRYAKMRERAAEHQASGNVEDEARDTEPERRAWGMLG